MYLAFVLATLDHRNVSLARYAHNCDIGQRQVVVEVSRNGSMEGVVRVGQLCDYVNMDSSSKTQRHDTYLNFLSGLLLDIDAIVEIQATLGFAILVQGDDQTPWAQP